MIFTKDPVIGGTDTSLPNALYIRINDGEEFPIIYTDSTMFSIELSLVKNIPEKGIYSQLQFSNIKTGESVSLTFKPQNV